MAPCRQLLMWSVPSIAVLLGIFWFKKKREHAKSDPGGRERLKSLKEELAEALNAHAEAQKASPLGKADRSIIKSSPIDIKPNGVNSQRSSPLELTDEEVDIEIEKIISRKKSIVNEKRLSAGFDNQNLVVSSSTVKPSFIVKESPPNMCSPLKTKMSCSVNANTSLNDEECSNDIDISIDKADVSQQASIKSVVTTSEINTNEESTSTDAEELNVNNVIDEPSDSNDSDNRFSTAQSRHISERDSANHSPVDPMLASPSMCHFSDNHSEVNLYMFVHLILLEHLYFYLKF